MDEVNIQLKFASFSIYRIKPAWSTKNVGANLVMSFAAANFAPRAEKIGLVVV